MSPATVLRFLKELQAEGVIALETDRETKATWIKLANSIASVPAETRRETTSSPSLPPPGPPSSLPLDPPAPLRGASPQGARRKACRIPDEVPTAQMREWAKAEAGGRLDVDRTALQFRDYWLGKAGQDGAKLDWFATWRRWIRTEIDRLPKQRGPELPLLAVVKQDEEGERLRRHAKALKSGNRGWARDYLSKFVRPDEVRTMIGRNLVSAAEIEALQDATTLPRRPAPRGDLPPEGSDPTRQAASY